VVIKNVYNSIMSQAATLEVILKDRTPPVVTITSPAAGATDNELTALTGSVSDNVGVAAVRWERNSQPVGALTLENGQFSVAGLRLALGENRFRVIATDPDGNEGSAEVVAIWAPSRTLVLVNPPPHQEGKRVVLPVELTSQGDVTGVTLLLRYDPTYLRDPELVWESILDPALKEVNFATPGEIRATFALPATTIDAGTRTIASVSFRARSVPNNLETPITVDALNVYGATGNQFAFGTDFRNGVLGITKRRIIADNNANDRLDVGDASIILRFVAQLETPRPWDTPSNDLNQNNDLDSGDVIRVLRTVVGLDPQPEVPGLSANGQLERQSSAAAQAVHSSLRGQAVPLATSERARLTLDLTRAEPGQIVTVQVDLRDIKTKLSGASFSLEYPPEALRLVGPLSHRTGPLVPTSAVTVWNVAPAQTNYSLQNGRVSVAASSPTAWATNEGVLAEFNFEVQPGAKERYRWSINLNNLEVTPDGFDTRVLPSSSTHFIGRDPLPSKLTAALAVAADGVRLKVAGELGVQYEIEASSDLQTWTPLGRMLNETGELDFTDLAAGAATQRFYRARQLE
jgi:hypothetical protein